MNGELFNSIKSLPDGELMSRVQGLVARERGATALLVAHLAELDTRDVLLKEGYSSLFAYCREALGMSDHEALNRIEAARAARRFPVVIGMLSAGRVHLTAVRLLAPHLTADNCESVLVEASGKRTEEIRAMAAALASRRAAGTGPAAATANNVAATANNVAAPPGTTSAAGPASGCPLLAAPGANTPGLAAAPVSVGSAAASTPSPAGVPSRSSASTESSDDPPASAPACRRHVAIAGDTIEKLRLAKEMLSHALPGGDEGEIVDRALTLLLADLARKKFAATDRPQPSRTAPRPGSRSIPAEVKRTVWIRDLGRCAYVGPGGHRCAERAFIEFHHVRPYEVGGAATVENIQLRCGRHNRYEAKVYFRREETVGAVLPTSF